MALKLKRLSTTTTQTKRDLWVPPECSHDYSYEGLKKEKRKLINTYEQLRRVK
jgi:hypothetical protein